MQGTRRPSRQLGFVCIAVGVLIALFCAFAETLGIGGGWEDIRSTAIRCSWTISVWSFGISRLLPITSAGRGQSTLNALAWKHKNLYVGMSGMLGPWYYAPMKLAHMVGEVMFILGGSEKLIFGTDWPASPSDLSVQAVLDLEIPEELQRGWGYPPITEQDRANMFGLNLAKMLKIEVPEESPDIDWALMETVSDSDIASRLAGLVHRIISGSPGNGVRTKVRQHLLDGLASAYIGFKSEVFRSLVRRSARAGDGGPLSGSPWEQVAPADVG